MCDNFFYREYSIRTMSKTLSRIVALEEISNWSTSEVVSLLQKNGLDDCCKAVQKRQVDGDEFLHLTEGKLALWKSDLTRPLTWSLWRFVEELKKSPEKYVPEKMAMETQSEELMSDSGSWGTDFEDDVEEDETDDGVSGIPISIPSNNNNNNNNNENETNSTTSQSASGNPEFRNSLMIFRENEKISLSRENHNVPGREKRCSVLGMRNEVAESTYTNCETDVPEDESTYANCAKSESPLIVEASKNVSSVHEKFEKTLAEQLREKLRLRNVRKPTIGPKPEVTKLSILEKSSTDNRPQKSFLHDVVPTLQQHQQRQIFDDKIVATSSPTVGELEKSQTIDRTENDLLPRPPVMIRNFDLLANLPPRTDESEGEYETFDEEIIEQNKRLSIARVDSKQSLSSGRQSSLESIYKTPSTTSQQEKHDEIYEYITETPEDNDFLLQPIEKDRTMQQAPPPLPAKPAVSPSPTAVRSGLEKKSERSPDKKSATLPHSGSGTSLTAELRATRPLPPPPDKQSYMDSPWFHNVTREQATALIKDRAYGNGQNGYFLLRPSISHPNNPLALVLWFKDRVYNVPVRKRSDNRYALGSAKINEQTFGSVEEIVKFYSREELVLHTGGVQTGGTKLTDTPPK